MKVFYHVWQKMMKNIFTYFYLKSCFVLKIFQFLFWIFGYVGKSLDKKTQVNFKNHVVANWLTNSCNTRIAKCLNKRRQCDNETLSVNRIWHEKYFSWKTNNNNNNSNNNNANSQVLYSQISLYVQFEDYQNILKLRCQQLAFTSCKAFLKNQKKVWS